MEFVIISGLSGAGKSRAASIMEDMGFFCVDNLPAPLIPKFAELGMAGNGEYDRVVLVTDIRGGTRFDSLFQALDGLRAMQCAYSILFMEATDEVIIQRYKETRRSHPLADECDSLEEAIALERDGMDLTIFANSVNNRAHQQDDYRYVTNAIYAKMSTGGTGFTDVPASHWAAGGIAYAVENGLMTGTSRTTFAPAAPTTRGMMMTILARQDGVSTSGGGTWYEKGMAWAKENARVSGLQDAPIRWIVDDCAKFVEREIRRGKTYDAIIMDPPSYGRGPGGEVWKLEENLYPFVKLCARVLSDKPLFVILNSYTTGLVGAGLYPANAGGPPLRRTRHLGRAGPAVHGFRHGAALRGHRPLDEQIKFRRKETKQCSQ